MKQTLLLLLVFFILILPTPNPALANSSKLYIPDPSYDFGQIPQGQTVEHVFVLKNSGKAPLEILSVTPDCNCAKVRLSTNRIKPGKQAELIVTFNSQGQRGGFTKLVIIETNDPVEPIKMIKIKGRVIKEDA